MYQAGQEMSVLNPEQLFLKKEDGVTEGLCLDILDAKGDTQAAYADVSVHFMFPLSRPWQLVTICDKSGKEIGIISDAESLNGPSRALLRQELDLAYFIPEITRIIQIKEEFGLVHWDVETNKGQRRFQVQSRYDIRHMGGNRYIVRDIDGNRYDITNANALDAASRSLLELEI